MAHLRKILFTTGFLLSAAPLMAADGGGVSPYAYKLFDIAGKIPVTNSMVTCWVISILLIIAIKLMVGKAQMIPTRGQAVMEGMLTGVYDIMEPIIGKKLISKVFPLLITLFIYILINNWSGLFPGVGSFGHFSADLGPFPTMEAAEAGVAAATAAGQEVGHQIRQFDGSFYAGHFNYYFRPANADLNTTLALAIISFIAWIWYVLRYAGPGMLLYDLFGNKADKKEVPGAIYYMLFIVFIGVGAIEVVSIMSRLVSLPFRLFGNVFGGENLLTSMHGMIAWIVPVPFFFLEILIGLVQALVFTLLTAVYIGLIVNHGDDEHH